MFKISKEKGFTLIELLVVVAIIGILVAIAIPQFASYKKQANNSAAQSQVRNVAVAMESAYVTNGEYTTTATEAALVTCCGYVSDSNVTMVITGGTTTWSATAFHAGGNKTYTWDAALGGMQ